jgi:hypothetical protein
MKVFGAGGGRNVGRRYPLKIPLVAIDSHANNKRFDNL